MNLRVSRPKILITSLLVVVPPVAAQADVSESIARGDESYRQRAEGHRGRRAQPQPIQQAIAAYTEALDTDPESLEARWKLLRALYFQGEFVLDDDVARLALFEKGREIADVGRQQIERQYGLTEDSLEMKPEQVAEAIGPDSLAAEIYFWSATHWGLWGRYRGKIAAAKQGVATKIRKFAEIVILLDETVQNAGGHRILGRLNAEAPKIPLFTGWIDRDTAIAELRRALELAPDDLLTQLFLAEALLEFRPERKEEARAILEAITASDPSVTFLVEDTKTIEDARRVLAETE
jgi:tetratricopeptide (TPR) repeat protein